MNKKYWKLMLPIFVVTISLFFFIHGEAVAKKPVWNGMVRAKLKSAQRYDWSAHDAFFTGKERGFIKYKHNSNSFKGILRLTGFKHAGPYVLTVDTADGDTLAGYDCDVWNPWAKLYGDTFTGGTNGCWEGNPYVDVMLFYLTQYDSDRDGSITDDDYYRGRIPFNVNLLNGSYNLKFFVKLDWQLTSPSANIMLMNNMDGNRRNGRVVSPKRFDYDEDLIIEDGLAAGKLQLADDAWCEPSCQPPSSDPGYQGTTGVIFYSTMAETFEGTVVLSNTVTPPTPQPLQIKLEGLGSLSDYADSNEKIGYIGRWWDNDVNTNISDAQYEAVKDIHDVLGYVIFDGLNTAGVSTTFALDSSYHVLWTPQAGRPAPGSVVMPAGDYVAYFALTENISWWRGIFLSENPLVFSIGSP